MPLVAAPSREKGDAKSDITSDVRSDVTFSGPDGCQPMPFLCFLRTACGFYAFNYQISPAAWLFTVDAHSRLPPAQ